MKITKKMKALALSGVLAASIGVGVEVTTQTVFDNTNTISDEFIKNNPATDAFIKNNSATDEFIKNNPATDAFIKNNPATDAFIKNNPATDAFIKNNPATDEFIKNNPATDAFIKSNPATDEIDNNIHDKTNLKAEFEVYFEGGNYEETSLDLSKDIREYTIKGVTLEDGNEVIKTGINPYYLRNDSKLSVISFKKAITTCKEEETSVVTTYTYENTFLDTPYDDKIDDSQSNQRYINRGISENSYRDNHLSGISSGILPRRTKSLDLQDKTSVEYNIYFTKKDDIFSVFLQSGDALIFNSNDYELGQGVQVNLTKSNLYVVPLTKDTEVVYDTVENTKNNKPVGINPTLVILTAAICSSSSYFTSTSKKDKTFKK